MLNDTLEIPLSGNTYRINRMELFDQFHVSRKLSPLISCGLLEVIKLAGGSGDAKSKLDWVLIMGPLSQVMASMSKEDTEMVLSTWVGVVQRQAADKWAPVYGSTGLQFEDIDLMVMTRLAIETIKFNLSSFFATALDAVTS